MKTYLLFELLLIYLTICRTVWAQTNSEPTTQLSGNSEPLTSTTIQTPKTGDNRTEYETTNAIEGNDSVSRTTTSDSLAVSDTTLKSSSDPNSEMTSNSEFVPNSVTRSNSGTIVPNISGPIVSEERQSPVVSDTVATTSTSDSNANELNSSSTEVTPQLMAKSGRQLNFSESDTSSESQLEFTTSNSFGVTNESTTAPVSRPTERLSSVTSTSDDITSQHSTSQTNTRDSSESVEDIGRGVGTSLKSLISSMLNPSVSTESMPQTTDALQQSAGVSTKIESERTPTETSVNYAENDTNSDRLYISGAPIGTSAPHQSDQTHDHTLHNQSLGNFTDSIIPTVIYANASDINNSTEPEASKESETTTQSLSSGLVQSTAQETLGSNETDPTKTHTHTHTLALNETITSETPEKSSSFPQESITMPNELHTPTLISTESSSEIQKTEQINRTEFSQPIQTSTELKPSQYSSEFSQTTAPFASNGIITTLLQTLNNSSVEPLRTSPETETTTSEPTQYFERSTPAVTETNVGILVANDSEPPIDSQTTFKLPLTDHSLKTTHFSKPLTTSIPHETNISLIRVVLPNIKYISSISKEDMVNIVTITFTAKSIDIFRWISIYDPVFRNHTCNMIDPERNWCTIDRFVYLSPSPLITNNHLILNFFIDDSNDNDLSNYHFFAGPQIVEALKNSTNALESMISMKVSSLQTNLGTMVVKPLESTTERLARLDLLLFVFIVVMFICTVLLCLAIICSYAKRKSVDMNQIQLSNAGRRHTTTNGGFDLNPASNILRDENQTRDDKLNHNVINLEGWVAPMDQIDNQKNAKYDNLQDTKL